MKSGTSLRGLIGKLLVIMLVSFANAEQIKLEDIKVIEVTPPSGVIRNGGFEKYDGDVGLGAIFPTDWKISNWHNKGKVLLDNKIYQSGMYSLCLRPASKDPKNKLNYIQQLSDAIAGRSFTLSGYIRTEGLDKRSGKQDISTAIAIWCRGLEKTLCSLEEKRTDSETFTFYSKTFTVPENATNIFVVCSAFGTSGEAWFDSITCKGGTLLCHKAKEPLKIDGNLLDWQAVKPFYLGESYITKEWIPKSYNGIQDLSCKFYSAWDKNYLYLAWDVTDDIHSQEYPDNDKKHWTGDSVQIYFDTLNNAAGEGYDKDDYVYAVWKDKKGNHIYREFCPEIKKSGGVSGSFSKLSKISIKRTASHTIYELAISLSELPPLKIKKGGITGFSFILNDNDGHLEKGSKGREAGLSLTPKGKEPYRNPYLYNDLVFE